MYGFPLDNLQWFVVILHYYMFTMYISMKLFKTKTNGEAFFFYVSISSLCISQCFACKCYGPIVLDECSAKTIFADISLQDKGLCAVIIC